MARPNRKPVNTPAPEATPPDADTTVTQPVWLDEHLRIAPSKTRAEYELREALWASFLRQQQAVRDFVAEKVAEGFSEAEVLELYALVTPLVPAAIHEEGKRPRVEFDLAFVERGSVFEGDGQ